MSFDKHASVVVRAKTAMIHDSGTLADISIDACIAAAQRAETYGCPFPSNHTNWLASARVKP